MEGGQASGALLWRSLTSYPTIQKRIAATGRGYFFFERQIILTFSERLYFIVEEACSDLEDLLFDFRSLLRRHSNLVWKASSLTWKQYMQATRIQTTYMMRCRLVGTSKVPQTDRSAPILLRFILSVLMWCARSAGATTSLQCPWSLHVEPKATPKHQLYNVLNEMNAEDP